jgi:DNA-directed RNA polymerase specialized sigma24 family protein
MVLTSVAFERLLEALDPDRGSAGERYELTRRKLIRFFDCHGAARSEDLADESLDRLARRLTEGESIGNPVGYVLGVARNVLRESWGRGPAVERQTRAGRDSAVKPGSDADEAGADAEDERRLTCLEGCLERLAPETRRLVLRYYEGKERAKIVARRDLARELGIGVNALRIRMHRIRQRLESCVTSCLAVAGETVSSLSPPRMGDGSAE